MWHETHSLVAAIAGSCPSGYEKLDATALEAFTSAYIASGEDAGCCSLVVDFDLTVSRGDGFECHHLLAVSPELPSAFREELMHLFQALNVNHPDNALMLGPPDHPDRIHKFWIEFNRIAIKHAISRADIIRAVEREKQQSSVGMLRSGWSELVQLCEKLGVPIVVLSAGLTEVVIAMHAVEGITLPASASVRIILYLSFCLSICLSVCLPPSLTSSHCRF